MIATSRNCHCEDDTGCRAPFCFQVVSVNFILLCYDLTCSAWLNTWDSEQIDDIQIEHLHRIRCRVPSRRYADDYYHDHGDVLVKIRRSAIKIRQRSLADLHRNFGENVAHSPKDHFCGLCQGIVCRDEFTAEHTQRHCPQCMR